MNERLMTRPAGMSTAAGMVAAALLGACAPIAPRVPSPMAADTSVKSQTAQMLADTRSSSLSVSDAPRPPATAASVPLGPVVETPRLNDPVLAAANIQQLPLPSFVQLIYSEVLKKSVTVHPSVLQRQDLVTFRTGEGQTASQIEQAVRVLLKNYGLSVVDIGGLVRVLPDNASLGDLPVIQYGGATPDVPQPLRPVFHLVTLQAVRQVDVVSWLRTMFGDRVSVSDDAGRNAVLLKGNPDNVKAALEAISALDQPAMKGRSSLALNPAYWSAEELARRLSEVLSAEGYAVHPVGTAVTPGAARYPIILLPISALNVVYVFGNSDAVASHVAEWARTLDRPNERGIGKSFFTYAVKHKDAELLAQTLDRILSGSARSTSTGSSAQGGNGSTGSAPGASAESNRLSSVVVDKSTNVLIFQARPEEYGQISTLLQTLDRPTKAALIEVTVAELSTDDSKDLGFDWLSDTISLGGGGKAVISNNASSLAPGAGLAGSGNLRIFNGAGAMRLAVTAMASTNRATILSSPRLMARNGETATIQVGQEVPIITSQQSTAVGGTAQPGLLQTVQYRSTGVILKIKPVIHSGDQVDLDVTQEVSESAKTDNGVTTTPTFKTRKIDTKLTLRNGATVLLGGLISENGSQTSSGIPFLKDVPVLGSLFGKQSRGGDRRELIVLITPYIANDAHDAEVITDAFRKSLGSWANQTKPLAPLPPGEESTPRPPAAASAPASGAGAGR
ncbi:secretin N-terminal domain-containing protein [Roseateles sp. DB2]|uniref:secretin N-terminal domain-containing protein n=1 Tax=Roseateles sp. DB2 TaxID=3453717 RepID=UPI003EEBC33F